VPLCLPSWLLLVSRAAFIFALSGEDFLLIIMISRTALGHDDNDDVENVVEFDVGRALYFFMHDYTMPFYSLCYSAF